MLEEPGWRTEETRLQPRVDPGADSGVWGWAEPQHFAGRASEPGGSPGRGQQGRGQQRTGDSGNCTKINTAGAEGRANQASARVSGRRGRSGGWHCGTGDTRAHRACHQRVPMPAQPPARGMEQRQGALLASPRHPSQTLADGTAILGRSGSSQPSEGSSPPGSSGHG